MNFLRLCAVILLMNLSVSWVFAENDVIAPVKKSFTVQAGQEFSYELYYKSGNGGVYDFFSREFYYDDKAVKHYTSETSDLVSVKERVYTFTPGEEKRIPLTVVIPKNFPTQDRSIAHFLRRRSTERQTFELGSIMLLHIEGAHEDWSAVLSTLVAHLMFLVLFL